MHTFKLNGRRVIWIGTAVLVFCLDRLFKIWAVQNLFNKPTSLVGDILTFGSRVNPYIAFSLPVKGEWLPWSISIVLVALVFYLPLAAKKHFNYFIALLILILGAASNLADRFLFGGVVDYLDIKYITVFNIADLMIVGSIFSLFYLLIYKNN